jgi:hypothetical protein
MGALVCADSSFEKATQLAVNEPKRARFPVHLLNHTTSRLSRIAGSQRLKRLTVDKRRNRSNRNIERKRKIALSNDVEMSVRNSATRANTHGAHFVARLRAAI